MARKTQQEIKAAIDTLVDAYNVYGLEFQGENPICMLDWVLGNDDQVDERLKKLRIRLDRERLETARAAQ